MPTPGPKKRKQNAGDDADNQELARLPKKGAALAEQIKSICGKYPWEIAEGFEPLTWGINLLEDFRALINLARGTVTITQVRNELQRLAGLHERSDRVNKLMKADIVATKTWVAEKIEHAETRSPEHSNKDEGEDGFSSPGEDTVADDTLSGDKSVTSTANLETGLMDEGDKECEEAHEEHQARPNGEHVGQHVDKNVDQALGPQTPVQSINDSDTTQSREKQANTGMVTTRKHSLPPISPTAPKRQKTANVYLGSGLQTTPEDEQIMDNFANWLCQKAADFARLSKDLRAQQDTIDMRHREAVEDASRARGQQVTEKDLKQSAEARLEAIKEDQIKEAAALDQLLGLQRAHGGVIGNDLKAVIEKMEAKMNTTHKGFGEAEKDTAAHTQHLDKLNEAIEKADSDATRLKQESEHLSKEVNEMKKMANLSSTANMFFKFGLGRTIEALEENFGDMKDWIERKIAAEGQNVDDLDSNSSQHV